jgi:hypothetical protein
MSASASYKVDELSAMKARIETMNKTHHIEILKILKRFPTVKLNENKSGVFINLNYLPEEATDELQKYIDYIDAQESEIMTVESRKEEYKNAFFTEKQNKEEGVLLV